MVVEVLAFFRQHKLIAALGIIGIIFFVIIAAVIGGAINQQMESDSSDCTGANGDSPTGGKVSINVPGGTKNFVPRMKRIAKATAPKVHISPALLFGQLWQEAGPNGSQPVNKKDNNFAGLTWFSGCGYGKGTPHAEGDGYYMHFKNDSQFASEWAHVLNTVTFAHVAKPRTVQQYVRIAKARHYMRSNDIQQYMAGAKMGEKIFGKGAKGTLSGAAKGADNAAADTEADCDESTDGGHLSDAGVVREAKRWIGKFPYSEARSAISGPNWWRHPNTKATLDCSSFVWLVLKRTGHKVPAQAWNTRSMQTYAEHSQYLKLESPKHAKAGDVIFENIGSDGHTVILAQNWHGPSTKCIDEDDTAHHVGVHPYNWIFYGIHGKFFFARPIK